MHNIIVLISLKSEFHNSVNGRWEICEVLLNVGWGRYKCARNLEKYLTVAWRSNGKSLLYFPGVSAGSPWDGKRRAAGCPVWNMNKNGCGRGPVVRPSPCRPGYF